MNFSSEASTPPVSHSNVLLSPLLIAGGIATVVTMLLVGFHFLFKMLRPFVPDAPPAPAKCAGDDVKKILNSIPVLRYKKNESSLKQISYSDCSVCLSAIEEGEKVRILPSCGHGFHSRCVDAWLQTRLSCPVCRAEVTAPEVCVPMPLVAVEEGGTAAAARAGKDQGHFSLPL